MAQLDPEKLFQRLANDLPTAVHQNVLVTGSLAAAYHFRDRLRRRGVNTKDADLIVQPAGNIDACQAMTNELLRLGWKRTDRPGDLPPQPSPGDTDLLPVIRLYPPGSKEYFVEFLNLPPAGQVASKDLLLIELSDGWSVLPSFKYMRVLALKPERSDMALNYAAPEMMALANLLSHSSLGNQRMGDSGLLRSAKDLGRVLALAWLTGRDGAEAWLPAWRTAIQNEYPSHALELTARLGNGLRELLSNTDACDEASTLNSNGLLSGFGVGVDALVATGERLLLDVIDQLQAEERRD